MKIIRDIATWSKAERRAIIILSVLLLFLFSGDIFFHRINPFENPSIHPDTLLYYKKLLTHLEEEVSTGSDVYEKRNAKNPEPEFKITKVYSFFDPNKLDQKGWEQLGFSSKQAISLLKYKASISSFKTKKDFKDAYVVSEDKYNELEAYIKIPAEEEDKKKGETLLEIDIKPNDASFKKEELFLDINSSDSISLLQLKGIGPFYASKIIQYRKELGFYVNKEQLLEIWKFDTVRLQAIDQAIYIDTSYNIKLKINSDSSIILKQHPYINWNMANAIANYRIQHGSFINKEDLKNVYLINDSIYSKLYPYISLE